MKEPKQGRGNYPVTWPKEYADFASHVVETAIAKPRVVGTAKTTLHRAVVTAVGTPVPTDIDDEFGDGAQNGYKIIKSLTSGARFYVETTYYAYRVMYRQLTVLLARALGLETSIKTKLDVSNAPNFAAYQMARGGVTENYLDAVEKLPVFDKILLEMISELNSLPLPSIGGLETIFDIFCHVYRDDRGLASDYFAFTPEQIAKVTYDDATKKMTALTAVNISAMNIEALAVEFFNIVNDLRDSVDLNNLMADMINALPSSRFDWMTVVQKHSDYERKADSKFRTTLASSPILLGTYNGIGVLNSAGTRIECLRSGIANQPSGYVSGVDDTVGQFVTTYEGSSESLCYKFMAHNENALPGFTPAGTDRISTPGYLLLNTWVFTSMGTPSSQALKRSVRDMYIASESSVQSTAEQGGKEMAILYSFVRGLPKLNLGSYGTSGSDDDLVWAPEDIRIAAVVDILNNIKAINLVAYSTVHLTTDRLR